MSPTPNRAGSPNIAYLVVGLVFLGIAASWALRASGLVAVGDLEWLLPATLVAAGAIGLTAFAVKAARGRRGEAHHTHGEHDINDDSYLEGDLR